MWLSVLSAVFKFFGATVLPGLIDGYKAKLAAQNTSEKIAADLAANEIAAQTAQANLNAQLKTAEIGHSFEPEKLAMYIVLLHLAKCVVWDTLLGLGSTASLKGDIATWEGMIMSFYFAKRGAENVARIIRR